MPSQPQTESSMKGHLKATALLGLPLIGAQLAQMSINVTDTVMMGWLGVAELAAGTLAAQTFFIFLIFGLGFAAAILPLVSGALGRGDERAVRRSARMGIWALLILSLLFMIPLWFTESILSALGQEPELVELAGRYMRIAQWSMIPAFLLIALRTFLVSLEKGSVVLWITLFTALLNGLLNYAYIFGNWGAPRLGIEGAALATLISNMVAFLITAFYVWRAQVTQRFEIFTRLWRPDWPAFVQIVRLGFPISLAVLAEAGLFSAASVMIGWLGTVPLAAHGIALQIASMAFMVPLGLSSAATVRVGHAMGRRDLSAIGDAGKAALLLTLGFAVPSAIIMLIFPEALARVFLDQGNPQIGAVLAYSVPLIWMAAAFQIVDCLQAVGAGTLRGLSDTKVPMIIAVISYWPVGVTVAWFLAFPLGFGGVGVWAGLACGLACASYFLVRRFLNREKLGLVPVQSHQ